MVFCLIGKTTSKEWIYIVFVLCSVLNEKTREVVFLIITMVNSIWMISESISGMFSNRIGYENRGANNNFLLTQVRYEDNSVYTYFLLCKF